MLNLFNVKLTNILLLLLIKSKNRNKRPAYEIQIRRKKSWGLAGGDFCLCFQLSRERSLHLFQSCRLSCSRLWPTTSVAKIETERAQRVEIANINNWRDYCFIPVGQSSEYIYIDPVLTNSPKAKYKIIKIKN